MSFFAVGLGFASLAVGASSAKQGRKAGKAAADAEARRLAIEADNTRKSLLLQAEADQAQQVLTNDRLALADQAEAQAEAEAAAAEGPDVTLAVAEDTQTRQRRRSSFFVQPQSGIQL